MNSKQFSIIASAAVILLGAGTALAEEPPQQQHYHQPGQGYEREPEYSFSGVIKKMPEKGLVGVWAVDDRLIVVTPMTALKEEQGKAAVGAEIAVRGMLRGIEFVALDIEVKGGQNGQK
jgi:hypothetical protein